MTGRKGYLRVRAPSLARVYRLSVYPLHSNGLLSKIASFLVRNDGDAALFSAHDDPEENKMKANQETNLDFFQFIAHPCLGVFVCH